MSAASNKAVLEALRERFGFTIVDRRGVQKLPPGTVCIADVGVHIEHAEAYVTTVPNSWQGLQQGLHEFGHFLQAWYWKHDGSIESRRRIVKNHPDLEACVLACWAAELLNVADDIKERLATEYDVMLAELERK